MRGSLLKKKKNHERFNLLDPCSRRGKSSCGRYD